VKNSHPICRPRNCYNISLSIITHGVSANILELVYYNNIISEEEEDEEEGEEEKEEWYNALMIMVLTRFIKQVIV